MNKNELLLKILNFILFAVCGISSFLLLADLILFGLLSLVISESIFKETSVLSITIITSIIFVVSLIGIIITNITIKNRIASDELFEGKYKKINKTTYILITLFLGSFGINKFIIGNFKEGIIRLLFWLLIIVTININIIPFMILYGLLGLIFSDFIVALTRKKDENNMIYVD